jgi:hypothetical protein
MLPAVPHAAAAAVVVRLLGSNHLVEQKIDLYAARRAAAAFAEKILRPAAHGHLQSLRCQALHSRCRCLQLALVCWHALQI